MTGEDCVAGVVRDCCCPPIIAEPIECCCGGKAGRDAGADIDIVVENGGTSP